MNEQDFAQRLKNTGRNDQCPCGSGKKYKKCHLLDDDLVQKKKEAVVEQENAEGSADRQKSNSTYFNGEVRARLKRSKTVARRNALRRQAGK